MLRGHSLRNSFSVAPLKIFSIYKEIDEKRACPFFFFFVKLESFLYMVWEKKTLRGNNYLSQGALKIINCKQVFNDCCLWVKLNSLCLIIMSIIFILYTNMHWFHMSTLHLYYFILLCINIFQCFHKQRGWIVEVILV